MSVNFTKVRCPSCGEHDRYRISRQWWMRVFPQSRRYECQRCGADYLCLFRS